jgi:DNA-binding helix-turn-helix protein
MEIENVINKIVQGRLRKGYSYENMAEELHISVPAYRKLEIGETKLSVQRLFQISVILEMPLTELLDIDNKCIMHNHCHNDLVYQQKIEHFYQENKEITEQLIKAKDELILQLQKEVEFLKSKILS